MSLCRNGHVKDLPRTDGRPGFRCRHCRHEAEKAKRDEMRALSPPAQEQVHRTREEQREAERRIAVYCQRFNAILERWGLAAEWGECPASIFDAA